jgi:hypothetical protein
MGYEFDTPQRIVKGNFHHDENIIVWHRDVMSKLFSVEKRTQIEEVEVEIPMSESPVRKQKQELEQLKTSNSQLMLDN